MGFKQLTTYNEEKKGSFFQLADDGDSAQVIFLYQSAADVLVADAHYIKSSEYSGYAHCCGAGCPACSYGERGIRVDSKIFIPLYNLESGKVEFWDRSIYFEHQLTKQVFSNFPNPSEYIFEIIRHGAARSQDTTYEIVARYKNTSLPYAKILADTHTTFPEAYEAVIRDLSAADMARMLGNRGGSSVPTEEYVPTPRSAYIPPSDVIPEPVGVSIPDAPVLDLPNMPEPVDAGSDSSVSSADPAPATQGSDDSSDDLGDVDF